MDLVGGSRAVWFPNAYRWEVKISNLYFRCRRMSFKEELKSSLEQMDGLRVEIEKTYKQMKSLLDQLLFCQMRAKVQLTKADLAGEIE